MNDLPTEVISHVALSIDDCSALVSFSLTNHRHHKLIQSSVFRTQWIENRLSCANNTAVDFKEYTQKPATLFVDANRLQVRLPLDACKSYLENWLINCPEFGKKPPVLPEDGLIREAFIVHAWKEAIPRFIRNQLMPPFHHNDRDQFKSCDGYIGPDFQRLSIWLVTFCARIFSNNWAESTELLPEGFFEAVQDPALMSSFRPGWIQKSINIACGGVSEQWKSWISQRGMNNATFDERDFEHFQNMLKKALDPWANLGSRDVLWRTF